MEKEYEKWLSIYVLRTLRCTQSEAVSIIGCRNETAVEAERWIEACTLDEAIFFCDDQAVKEVVDQNFPTLARKSDQLSLELLVKAGKLTGDDILRHYRRDYRGMRAKYEEQQRFLTLLEQWREQIQFLSLDQLLDECWFKNWRTDLEREVNEPEDIVRWHVQIHKRHRGKTPRPSAAMLPVESAISFKQLKRSYPDAQVWRAQESWGEAYGIYMEAFFSWLAEVDYVAELVMGSKLKENVSGDLDSRVADARRLIKELRRENRGAWLSLRLLTLAMACDLVVLGIQEQSPNAFWLSEAGKIRKLRDAIVFTSMKELPQDFWLTGENRVHALAKSLWDSYQPVKEETTALLKALGRLQTAHNDVHDKLNTLELGLRGPVHASTPSGGET